MNGFILFFKVLLLLCAQEGNAATSQIKCYECSSMTSHEDCAVNKTERQCAINVPGFDWTCGKSKLSVHMHHNTTDVVYSRGCVLANNCKKGAFCRSKRSLFEAAVSVNVTDRLAHFSCELYCCKNDLCNASSSGLLVSGFILNALAAILIVVFLN